MFKLAIAALVVTIALSVGWQANQSQLHEESAACGVTTQEQMERTREVNACVKNSDLVQWKRWLSGRSFSIQFHFLDLIELLFGEKHQQTDRNSPSSFL